jgi:hypothetical protein
MMRKVEEEGYIFKRKAPKKEKLDSYDVCPAYAWSFILADVFFFVFGEFLTYGCAPRSRSCRGGRQTLAMSSRGVLWQGSRKSNANKKKTMQDQDLVFLTGHDS